jgi:hypothetical protein
MVGEGMRGTDHQQSHIFSYLSPEKRIRGDHPLRAIRDMVDEALSQLSRRFEGATTDPVLVAQLSTRLDAVFDFTIFVAREFLLRNYSLEKHQSDIFDQFQLQYPAVDRFVIVTADPDLSTRTRKSPQAARIMSFDQFLRTL